LHTVGVFVAGSAVPAFVAVTAPVPATVVDGTAVAILALQVGDAGRVDEGARLVDGVEVVVGVRVFVVAHVLLELADFDGRSGLVQHALGRLEMVGLTNAHRAVGVRVAAECGLFDHHLRLAQGELSHRVCGREHGQNHQERRNVELEHENLSPELAPAFCALLLFVSAGLAAVEGYADPLF